MHHGGAAAESQDGYDVGGRASFKLGGIVCIVSDQAPADFRAIRSPDQHGIPARKRTLDADHASRQQALSAAQRRKNVAVALQVVGLADRAKHKPRELSGGQEQRVAIARALVSDPQLLVCDEPTGDLDRKTADEILGLLQVLNREHGKTIVIVTHDPKAAGFARRTLHLEKGQLLEQAA